MHPLPGAGDFGPLANASDECLVFDLGGRIVAVNEAAQRVLGCSADELKGRRAWEVCTCLTALSFEHAVEAMRVEGPQSLLGHLRRRDGRLIATDTRLWIASFAGRPHVYALAREMRGYQAVLEERDRLAHLVEASSEVVILFDGEFRTTYANAATLERLGFANGQDLLGVSLHELVPPNGRAQVEDEIVPQLLRGAWQGELEFRSWRAPDERTAFWAHAFQVRHSRSGQRVGYALSAHDIGPRRAADLRRTRLLRLAEVARKVATSLLARDDLNEAVAEILAGVAGVLGASRGRLDRIREDGERVLRTHTWSPARGAEHHPEATAEPRASLAAVLEALGRGESLRIDGLPPGASEAHPLAEAGARALLALPVFIRGGLESVFSFTCHVEHAWQDDEVAAVQLIVDSFARGVERQIAEREELHARRQLEEAVEREKVANRYKSEFLASMSHELRTPVNAIRGYAELLTRPNPERSLQETWIQNLRRSADYLLGLVHDVLDLSKIEAGHMQLEPEATALAEVLVGVEELLATGAREKCLSFSIVLEGELPESLRTDPVRLKQILVNLGGNAVKFTSKGRVVIRVQRRAAAGGERLVFAVEDTGIGIPPEALDKLFRPFSQVNQRSGGTGLGLQISRSLARLLGGDIAVQSRVGVGSVFTLDLPLEDSRGVLRALPSRTAPAVARSVPAGLAGRRLLVVDDSLENREVLRFLLLEAGATCESAVNGRAGVEQALAAEKARAPFDAILMDMNMPVMNGFDAARKLCDAGVSSPILALTAMALAGDEQRCLEAGCVAYIGKPIVPSVFFETLAKHVRPAAAPAPAAEPRGEGQLLSLVDHPRFRGLLERYVASFPELVERIRILARDGELEEVRTLVHRLRGTAATYGFPGVSQAAGRCEDAIRAGASREELAHRLDDLLGRLTLAAAG